MNSSIYHDPIITSSFGTRPVINLKGDLFIIGDGTETNATILNDN